MQLANDFKGGSLNDVYVAHDRIIKRYSGPLDRGAEKLREECLWLNALPKELLEKYPQSFPAVIDFINDRKRNITELHIARLPRASLCKLILSGQINSEEACEYVKWSLRFLLDDVYPIRSGDFQPSDMYAKYHSQRLSLARKYLRRLPYLAPILDASGILVNGIHCPSVNQFLAWLDTYSTKIFLSGRAVAMHGNFHLDNILIDKTQSPSKQDVTFIDPRGDFLGPPHYDIAKLLITLEAYYDEIHYDGASVKLRQIGRFCEVGLEVDESCSPIYTQCLLAIKDYLPKFAAIEGLSSSQLLFAIYTCQCIHILSFCFYHAYRIDASPSRIKAFLAIFALLVRRLFQMWDNRCPVELPHRRILLSEVL